MTSDEIIIIFKLNSLKNVLRDVQKEENTN